MLRIAASPSDNGSCVPLLRVDQRRKQVTLSEPKNREDNALKSLGLLSAPKLFAFDAIFESSATKVNFSDFNKLILNRFMKNVSHRRKQFFNLLDVNVDSIRFFIPFELFVNCSVHTLFYCSGRLHLNPYFLNILVLFQAELLSSQISCLFSLNL